MASVSLSKKSANELVTLARQLLIPRVLKYLPEDWQPVESDAEALAWLSAQQADFYQIDFLNHGVQPAGLMIVYQEQDKAQTDWYLGFMLLPKYWGQGLAKLSVLALQQIARDQGVNKIIAGATATNVASQRVLEHSGFVIEQQGDMLRAIWQVE